jgi:tripartite-type tricarboxylate transporter receptor subunit TctC
MFGRTLLAHTLLCLTAAGVHAQPAYPVKPIRILVPFAPGGSSDIQARLIGAKLAEAWGQSVIIDNRAGAGGIAAADIGAHALPDGYTLFMGHIGTQAANPALYRSLPYSDTDFAPVVMTVTQPMVLIVPPKSAASSVQELIALAHTTPGKLDYASAGNGSPNHLAAELFKTMTKIDLVHVPYKGSAPAEIDIMAGRVALFFDTMLSAMPFVKDGRVKALAVTGTKRSPSLPAVPTVAESGVPGYAFLTWNGFFVPAGTPPAVIAKLNGEISRILRSPEIEKRLTGEGADIAAGTPEAFGAFVKSERQKLAKVIKEAGIRID